MTAPEFVRWTGRHDPACPPEEAARAFHGVMTTRRSIRAFAPWLVVVMRLTHADDGSQVHYAEESVGIATGLFLAAAHHAGLATLTHTPRPMRLLCDVLRRPPHERPFVRAPDRGARPGRTADGLPGRDTTSARRGRARRGRGGVGRRR